MSDTGTTERLEEQLLQPMAEDNNRGVTRGPWFKFWVLWLAGGLIILLTIGKSLAGVIIGIGFIIHGLPGPDGERYFWRWYGKVWRDFRVFRTKDNPYTYTLDEILEANPKGIPVKKKAPPVALNHIPLNRGDRPSNVTWASEWVTPDNGLHYLDIIADGWGKAASGNAEDVHNAGLALSDALLSAANEVGAGMYCTISTEAIPSNIHPGVSDLEALQVAGDDDPLVDTYIRALDKGERTSRVPVTRLTYGVPRPRSFKGTLPEDIPENEFRESVLARIASDTADRLRRAGAYKARVANPFETIALTRAILDPSSASDAYADWLHDKREMEKGNYGHISDSFLGQAGPFPEDVEQRYTYLRIGNSYTKMYRLPLKFKDTEVFPGQLHDLFYLPSDINYGMAVVMQAIKSNRETQRVKARRFSSDVMSHIRAGKGASESYSEAQSRAALERKDAQQYRVRNALNVKFTVIVSITVVALEQRDAMEALKSDHVRTASHFGSLGFKLIPVTGNSVQMQTRQMMLGHHAPG